MIDLRGEHACRGSRQPWPRICSRKRLQVARRMTPTSQRVAARPGGPESRHHNLLNRLRRFLQPSRCSLHLMGRRALPQRTASGSGCSPSPPPTAAAGAGAPRGAPPSTRPSPPAWRPCSSRRALESQRTRHRAAFPGSPQPVSLLCRLCRALLCPASPCKYLLVSILVS